MKEVGFGIIGFGRQGFRFAEHIKNDVAHGKLVAVCRRSAIENDYLTKHGIKFYSDYRALLSDKNVDAVIITTPSSLHGFQAIDALKSKKHILIDKPIASTLKEGQRILALSKKEKLTVAINFPLRVNPVTSIVKQNLGKIGKVRKIQLFISHGPVRNTWQSDMKLSNGGVILDLGSHYFDLISFLTGSKPEKINNAYSDRKENEDSGLIDISYKDFSVSAILQRNQKLKRSIIICAGDRGSISADYVSRKVVISNNHQINEIECPMSHDLKIIIKNFVRAINNKEEITANAEAGLHSLKTAFAIYKAIKTGRPVRL